MATAIVQKEKTLADLRQELFDGSNELFEQFLASIAEQSALTPEQSGKVGEYLAGAVEKRDKLAALVLELEEHADVLDARAKRLSEAARQPRKIAQMIRSSVLANLQNNPAGIIRRVDGLESSFRVAKNPAKVEIVSLEDIPDEYGKYEFVPDKRAIKDALEDGKEVPGAQMAETTYRLEIR